MNTVTVEYQSGTSRPAFALDVDTTLISRALVLTLVLTFYLILNTALHYLIALFNTALHYCTPSLAADINFYIDCSYTRALQQAFLMKHQS